MLKPARGEVFTLPELNPANLDSPATLTQPNCLARTKEKALTQLTRGRVRF
jgi:hypothetical protein